MPDRVEAKLELPWKDVAQPLALKEPDPSNTLALMEWLTRALTLTGDGLPCVAEGGTAETSAEGTLTLHRDYRCVSARERLSVESKAGASIGTGYSTFVEVRREGSAPQRALLTAKAPAHEFVAAKPESAVEVAFDFVKLGMHHIFTGYDHMLFLLTILLLGGSLWRIVGLASAFTVAHTITLSLAATKTVQLPSRLTETAIAASIAYVAAENWIHARPPQSGEREAWSIRWRWLVTFAFGLIHGFGFASALAERGLPREHLPLALGSFNAGVELGQISLIVLAYPALRWASKKQWYRPLVVRWISGVAFGVGMWWFVQRALGWS